MNYFGDFGLVAVYEGKIGLGSRSIPSLHDLLRMFLILRT